MWGLFGPENQSQLKRIRWNRDWQFFRGNHGNVHAGTFTVRLLSNLNWIEAQTVLCCLKSPATQRGNSPKSLRTFALSDHDERKTKAYWKQSKYIHFSVGFCLFSCSLCVCVWVMVDDTGVGNHTHHWGTGWMREQHLRFLSWGLAGEGGTNCCTFSPLTFVSLGLCKRWRLDPTVDVSRTVGVQLWTADR